MSSEAIQVRPRRPILVVRKENAMLLTTLLAARAARRPPTASAPWRPRTLPCPLCRPDCPLRLDPVALVYVDTDGIALDPDEIRARLT